MWGINRRRKGIEHTWAALRTIRAARPDGAPVYVILDNLSAHTKWRMKRWAARNKVELCFTPTYASWANPIEAHFGPLRQFTLANSHHPNHTIQTRALHARKASAGRQTTTNGSLTTQPGKGSWSQPGEPTGERTRSDTPRRAIAAGASRVVVGRTATRAADPVAAFRLVRADLEL
ncbi:Transposase [Streptomyces venezuelae]|nr:Transposase [Streptomyces venezuelae]CUM36988.1 Mobile element protein [Streptomyces venezuelae]